MKSIVIPGGELFDQDTCEFIQLRRQTIVIEHSLVSISKWESKWHKPFMDDKPKTIQESIDYIRCMTLTQNVDSNLYRFVTDEVIDEVAEYIKDPMTATWFPKDPTGPRGGRDVVTSELIYYWMIAYNIPMECQKWHLNRLITLIRVCEAKNAPKKKMSKRDMMNQNAKLNAMRRAQSGGRG